MKTVISLVFFGALAWLHWYEEPQRDFAPAPSNALKVSVKDAKLLEEIKNSVAYPLNLRRETNEKGC
jgi:hypothetical protein